MASDSPLNNLGSLQLAQIVQRLITWARNGPGPVDAFGSPTDGTVPLGAADNQWNRIYAKELWLNGIRITDIDSFAFQGGTIYTANGTVPTSIVTLNFLVLARGGQGGGGGGGGGGAGGTNSFEVGGPGWPGGDGIIPALTMGIATRPSANIPVAVTIGGGGSAGALGSGGSNPARPGDHGTTGGKGGDTVIMVGGTPALTFTGGAGGLGGRGGTGNLDTDYPQPAIPAPAAGDGAGGGGGAGVAANTAGINGTAGTAGAAGVALLIPY